MRSPRRGEIYPLFSDDVGKRRPVVVVSITRLNGGDSVLVVPFFSQQLEKWRALEQCSFFQAGEGGLQSDCVAICDGLTRLLVKDLDRRAGPLGTLNEGQMARITEALQFTLGIAAPSVVADVPEKSAAV